MCIALFLLLSDTKVVNTHACTSQDVVEIWCEDLIFKGCLQ